MPRFLSLTTPGFALAGAFLLGCQANQDIIPTLTTDCLVSASANNGRIVAGAYIVTYQPGDLPALPNARVSAAQVGTSQLLARHHVANAETELLAVADQTTFLAHLTTDEATELQQDPAITLLEPDRIVSMCSCVDVTTPSTVLWNVTQTGYGRGDLQTGKTAWIIDTGIDLDHPDLNVDVTRSRSFVSSSTTADDQNGHGTHVAGIIGAKNNTVGVTGVASGATLVGLKVLNQLGEGRLSGIIQAVNHVRQNGRAGDVVNLSLGSETVSTSLDNAIRQAASVGILFAIAAGNESQNADDTSPARVNVPNVFTVSAMDRANRWASFSNFGASVDVCAYGVRITSTYKDGQYATLSGTSMAAPHVAGLLLIRGNNLPTSGYVTGDPDGTADPIAGE